MGIYGRGPLAGVILLPFDLINVAWAKLAKVDDGYIFSLPNS